MDDDFPLPPIRFEARELKKYSEPIRADDLKQRSVYLSLNVSKESNCEDCYDCLFDFLLSIVCHS